MTTVSTIAQLNAYHALEIPKLARDKTGGKIKGRTGAYHDRVPWSHGASTLN